MSSTLPPPPPPPRGPTGPPPSGPPSGPPGPPPSGPPEYLESGAGGPLPQEPRGGGSAVRRGLFVGGAVVGLVAVGVGAWAAYSFLTTGPQPAEALPANTLGYASIDLDPSGGQKIEALKTLNKFPAFKDYVGINADDDLRKEIFSRIQDQANCEDIDYAGDIEPWLGDRAAFAAVDLGGKDPDPVIVIQIKDADKADTGLDKIKDCGNSDGLGWAVDGDWAVVAESDDIADKVVAATKKGSLADDEDFRKWTDEAGDPGVMTLYAGPEAGDYLADHADDLFGFPLGLVTGTSTECFASSSDGGTSTEGCTDVLPGDEEMCSNATTDPTDPPLCSDSLPGLGAISDDLKAKFRDFKGLAVTVRFSDGAIEVEAAGDSSLGGTTFLSGGATADVVQSLPADTGAVLGVGFKEGWFGDLIDYAAPYAGTDSGELLSQLSDMTGLDLPADAETLAGDSAALALGSDFDPESFFSSDDGSDIPIALKIKGDPGQIEKVLDKLRDSAGPQANVLESDADGDVIVIGPNADYRADVLKDGGLGDNDVFKDVVREADRAQTILFIDVDEFEVAIEHAAGDSDQEFIDNLKPISGLGVTAWVDDEVSHAVFRLATN